MKKIIASIILLLIIGGICYFSFIKDTKDNEIPNLANEINNNEQEDKVQEIFKDMTLEEKIGQMIIIDLPNSSLTESDINLLKEIKPGGIILFGNNFTTYQDTISLIKEAKNSVNIPMFISIDEEGGRVSRTNNLIDTQVAYIPPMLNVGNTNDENTAYEIGKIIGKKLNVFGINMDFAPVLDVYSNPKNTVIGNRSFGSNPNKVAKMGLSVAKGLDKQNIISVYKHFPGHGDTSADSHFELPVINKTITELEKLELIPFQKAIDNGAKVIMVGHLAVPNITSDNTPASLSKEVITNLLKKNMGYNNLVITDSLKMKAITDNYQEKEIYRLAINAGVDILLMPQDPAKAINLIKEMVLSGEIDEKKVDNATLKILRLKELKIMDNYDKYLDKNYLNHSEYEEILSKIS